MRVSRDYIEKNLVGKKDFTFIDITEENIKGEPEKFDFPTPRRQEILKPILANVNANSTRNFMAKLTSFSSRRSNTQSGQDSVLMIKSELEKIINGLPNERKNRFSIELVKIPNFIANSIIVKMIGSGNDKDQHVLFGAHSDDVGHPNAGADDDGSGTTCVFESFRVVSQSNYNPSRSLAWFFYSAEESGLVGSSHIVRDWKSRNVKVVGHLNYDMVGNHPASQPLAGRRLTVNTTPKITEYMFQLSKVYTVMDVNTWAFGGGSDHIPWTRNGYESACMSERVFSPHYHGRTDKIENVNQNLLVEFSKLGAAYLVETS
jgi:leucyl aminopeptidase